MADKYVTFKREDWDRFLVSLGFHEEKDEDGVSIAPPDDRHWYHDQVMRLMDHGLSDAVVIRHQDVFAASAFAEYAGQIRTAIDVTQHLTEGVVDAYDDDEMERLSDLADYFADQARWAENAKRKLPD